MEYQWYPGHMTKAKRRMQEDIRLVDLLIELLDARVPLSSRNPDIDGMAENKARIVLLNKADLADPGVTARWENYFKAQGLYVMTVNAKTRTWVKPLQNMIRQSCAAVIERDRRRGMKERPLRAMAAGIPNVGKSTFINTLAGKNSARTGNRPGVTRANQWISLNKDITLLDTPGILWPKFEDQRVGQKLALIGSIRDEILDSGELSLMLVSFLKEQYPGVLAEHYNVSEDADNAALIENVAARRGALKAGGAADTDRAAAILLDDFRSGRLGRITLEKPEKAERSEKAEKSEESEK